MKLDEIVRIYEGSNGEATIGLYDRLSALGPAGIIATNLFRACKASERAKLYSKRSFKAAAYDKKSWSMNNLCEALASHAGDLGIRWGWAIDDRMRERVPDDPHFHVLYIDTPKGQVSFHNGSRLAGPDYPDKWDGARKTGPDRICRWIADLIKHEAKAAVAAE